MALENLTRNVLSKPPSSNPCSTSHLLPIKIPTKTMSIFNDTLPTNRPNNHLSNVRQRLKKNLQTSNLTNPLSPPLNPPPLIKLQLLSYFLHINLHAPLVFSLQHPLRRPILRLSPNFLYFTPPKILSLFKNPLFSQKTSKHNNNRYNNLKLSRYLHPSCTFSLERLTLVLPYRLCFSSYRLFRLHLLHQ